MKSLSELLEKIQSKYPDDEDVQALAAEMDMDSEMESEDPFAEDMGDEEAAPEMSFDDMFAEDMAEDEMSDEEDMDMPAPKKKSKLPF